MVRPIYKIAQEIKADWHKPYFGAVPYLNAMTTLTSIDDTFVYDSADEIVRRFLANASTWRGDTAKRIKQELRSLLK